MLYFHRLFVALYVSSFSFSLVHTLSSLSQSKLRQQHLQDVLVTRRTVNDFDPILPNYWERHLEEALQAAIMAPNHKRTEPWRFHLLGPQHIRQVCELNASLVTAKKGQAAGDAKLKRWLAIPGWLVVTQVVDVDDDDHDMNVPTSVVREDYAACCCAVQNIMLSLHAHEIGTKWTSGPVNFDEGFAAAAGLSGEEVVVGTLWFGKQLASKESPKSPRKRRSVEDVLIKHS